MTREKFPRKKAGDHLSEGHVNRLSEVCERVADPNFSETNLVPNRQYVLQVTNTQIDASDAADSGLYLGRRRWYSHVSSIWQIDDMDYEIDASDVGLTLNVGAKVVAFWDAQRGMFILTSSIGFDRCNALLKGALASGDATATVDNVVATRGASPLDDPTDAAEELTVDNFFAWDGDDNAPCKIEYNEDDDTWELYQVKCPA